MVPSDQCIEQTINREQKCHGGITGSSTSPGTVQRWVLTSHIASKCYSILEDDLLKKKKISLPKDLGISRRLFDEKAVIRCYEVLQNWGNPFHFRQSLVQICSGVVAPPPVHSDLIEAESIGKAAMNTFIQQRMLSSEVSFYAAINKLKLKTFEELNVKKVCNAKEKSIVIAAERSMFARLLVIAQVRDVLPLREILAYSLGPIPWPLALPDGGLVKTVKSKLLASIKKNLIAVTTNAPQNLMVWFWCSN